MYRQPNKKRTRISTKTKRKSEALRFLTNFKKEVEARKNKPSINILQFKQTYEENILITHTKGSYNHSKRSLEKFMEYSGEDLLLSDITKAQTEEFILKCSSSLFTRSLYLRTLKAAFSKAVVWEYIKVNPFKHLKIVVPYNHPVYIGVEELNNIVENEVNPTLSSIYRFAFYTGLRAGEIVNLEWSDINWENKVIKVQNKQNHILKGKVQRNLPISNIVYEILFKIRNSTGYVFNRNGETIRVEFLSKKFKKAVRKSGVDDKIHFHSLRHSFASQLAKQGVSLYQIQRLLGHKNPSQSMMYSHLQDSDLRKIIEVL